MLSGDRDDAVLKDLIQELRRRYLPQCVVLVKDSFEQNPSIDRLAPFVALMNPLPGQAAAYVCRDHRCFQPVHTAADMLNLLDAKST